MAPFRAIIINKDEQGYRAEYGRFNTADLMDGDVTLRVLYSALNYKDGLAMSGRSPVVRRFPMIAGIDAAAVVETSDTPAWKAGDHVILNGWGLGETHLGAYAETMRVKSAWLTRLPAGMTPRTAMAIGTAGYTAMLSLMALERQGLKPADGPVIVTGAAGGVGSVAVALLAAKGFQVIASTGRPQEADYLKTLGAAEIIHRDTLSEPAKPLARERFAGAIDSVGSHTLANVLSQMTYGGVVAACGLAQGMDLPASVAPFILRGVSLLGIDSVMASQQKRTEAWKRLAQELDPARLETMTREVGLEEVLALAEPILQGKVRGRTVVRVLGDV